MTSKPSARSEARSVLSGLYERGEEVVSVFLEELLRNPRVSDQLGKTVERAVDAKRRVDKNMQTVLSVLNLPSRADYNRVLAKIDVLQGSLTNLSMKVDRLLAQHHETASRPTVPPPRRARPRAKRRARPEA